MSGPRVVSFAVGARHRRVLVVSLLILLLTAGAVTWTKVTGVQLDRTRVLWSGPVHCGGSESMPARHDDQGRLVLGVRLREGMQCRLPVRIENDGFLPVVVESLLLPYMGPGGGAAVQVVELDGRRPSPDPLSPVDAEFPVGREIPAGEGHDFTIDFVFRPDGCTARGTMWVAGLPRVRVSTLGRPGTTSAANVLAFHGTRDSDCDA